MYGMEMNPNIPEIMREILLKDNNYSCDDVNLWGFTQQI
jgi:hypothetical protein